MPVIRFHLKNGKTIETQAENLSLMEAAVKADVPYIEGACGGSLACATCHVHIRAEDFDRVAARNPLSEEEVDMLELAENRQKHSRLSCQIVLKPEDLPLDVFLP